MRALQRNNALSPTNKIKTLDQSLNASTSLPGTGAKEKPFQIQVEASPEGEKENLEKEQQNGEQRSVQVRSPRQRDGLAADQHVGLSLKGPEEEEDVIDHDQI